MVVAWQELIVVAFTAAVLCAALIVALRPLIARYAMARPNARSSHTTATPQGGGIAVIAAILIVAVPTAMLLPEFGARDLSQIAAVSAAAVALAIVGAVDDVRTIEVLPRLALQIIIGAALVILLPADLRIAPFLPLPIERLFLAGVGVVLVNIVNFMDGIDWMTVAEIVPVTACVAILAAIIGLPPACLLIAIALGGAMLGFAPFNRPVASLFLGDVGSLPIGIILLWLLVQLAAAGHGAIALLLPLYYLADSLVTLAWRMARGERITEGHRSHFYQVATTRGFSVLGVVTRVFAVNVILSALAVAAVMAHSQLAEIAALAVGGLCVVGLLFVLAKGKR